MSANRNDPFPLFDLSDGLPEIADIPDGSIADRASRRAASAVLENIRKNIRTGNLPAISDLFAAFKTDRLRERAASRLILPAIESNRPEMVRLIAPSLSQATADQALNYIMSANPRVNIDDAEYEKVRWIAPKASQGTKDFLLCQIVSHMEVWWRLKEYHMAELAWQRVPLIVAAGGDPTAPCISEDVETSISKIAEKFSSLGAPELSWAISAGKKIAATWAAETDETKPAGYSAIFESIVGQPRPASVGPILLSR